MRKKNKNIHNLLIIDASGSMRSKTEEVIGGINQIFTELKEDKESNTAVNNKITVVDFSSHGDFKVLYDAVEPENLIQMKDGDYIPRAMTALYDAIGKAFQLIQDENDGVFVTIFTDGQENDSKEFDATIIKQLIRKKEADDWIITFMGTTEQAMMEAQSIGITRDKMLSYTDSKAGSANAFKRMSKSRKKYMDSIISEQKVIDIFDKENTDDTAI